MILKESEMLGKPILTPKPTNGWVAGGAVRCWFTNEKVSDYDYFFKNTTALRDFQCLLSDYKLKREDDKLIEYVNDGLKIQLIKKFFNSVEDLFAAFDFHLCQFAWDGETIFTTKEAIISVLRKRLSVSKIQPGFQLDSLRRAFKYFEKGYRPCAGAIADLGKALGMTNEDISAQSDFYPDGQPRIRRFD